MTFHLTTFLLDLVPFIDEESKELKIDWEDEIVKASTLTLDGKVVNKDFV